jgi:Fe-S-cluster-containing dehydrogenase component/DMSO reductase anchor subunit
MTRWVMLADLDRCVGCQTCTAACRHANATSPAVQWRKVLDIEAGSYPDVSRTFVPVGCQHCADPPCMHVCPSTATRQRADGIVTIDYDICIGCAYCDVACPYQARFKVDAPRFAYGDTALQNETEREDPSRIGVAQKCTFCSDRIDFGLAHGLTPGLDPRATPACVNACIADALQFGDIDDPGSNVSRLLREQQHFRMHEEIGTQPGFYYLYGKAAAKAPAAGATSALPKTTGKLRASGVEPWHQRHWDWKAAGNFICGGAGSGLFVFAALADLRLGTSFPLGWVALALVALGLFLVLLKIGRPWRSIYVLRQPQRSWMAREAWIAGFLFPFAALATWLDRPALMIPAAVLALGFLFSQTMILRDSKGIPAWRTPRIVALIIATGLAEGAGLFLAAAAMLPSLASITELAAVVALMLAAARGWSWRSYLRGLRVEGAPAHALGVLERFAPWFLVLGLTLPMALIILALAAPHAVLFTVAGLCIAGAGADLKFILVTRAGYNQGFALAHLPERGRGISLPGVKPGWVAQ